MSKKSMRSACTIFIFCALLFLSGCHYDTSRNLFPSKAEVLQYNGNKAIISGMEVNDKGYYFLADDILYFYDISSGLSTPMCSRTECSHTDADCGAYASSRYTEDDFSWICDGKEIMLYDDKLYMIEHTKDIEYYLCQYDTSYNNKSRLVKLSDFKNDATILSPNGAYAIDNGYLYYCILQYDEEAIKGDYIFEFNCMRVKLEKDAVPEKLGSFHYPGDHGVTAEASNGISVMCNNGNVYFFASASSRMWKRENTEQCVVMRYNTDLSEFKELYASINGWDSGIGKIEGSDDRVCMDNAGNIYAISNENSIVVIHFETGIKKTIYSLEHTGLGDSISSLVCDGQYLYFIATDHSTNTMATYLRAIDTNGELIRSYEFKVDEDYFDNSNADAPGNLEILGLDNRNIMVLSNRPAYEGLSTDRTFPIEIDHCGAGLINLADFLEGRDIAIKQIY